MTERVQNVAPRARPKSAPRSSSRPAPRAAAPRSPSRSAASARPRRMDFARWVRLAGVAILVILPIAGYYVAAGSELFALRQIEVVGATRTPSAKIEKLARDAAGSRLLGADLDAVRQAVEAERGVQSVSVVRVLPDTIRVRVEEREPAVVVKLSSGALAWADTNGKVVSDFRSDGGDVPPPLTGYEDGDRSDRAAADNRDRVATYATVRDALSDDKLWDWIDEVNVRYLKDVQVRLVDSGILVRLGGEQYRERLTRALLLIDAAKRGDADALARMNVASADAEKMIASPDIIGRIDATAGGRMSIAYRKAGAGDGGRN